MAERKTTPNRWRITNQSLIISDNISQPSSERNQPNQNCMQMDEIRLVGRFIFANAFLEINDSVDYESIGMERPTESVPVRFDIEAVIGWHPDLPNQTLVRLVTGSMYILDLPIDVFDQFMAANGSV
ncbi:MAG: hypothetical protein ACK528_08140 [Alphaproteobacteria bacterium]